MAERRLNQGRRSSCFCFGKSGNAEFIDHGDRLISAGFVNCHAHYSQLGVIASYGTQLLDWLETYIFSEGSAFGEAQYALTAAESYLDECLKNCTTSASVYGPVHAQFGYAGTTPVNF